MNNTELLNRISTISETQDPKIFGEIISTVSEQIKSEKQKQEIKLIIEDVAHGLIRFYYDLEDEKFEQKFFELLDELVVMGVDIGKILIGEFSFVKNSEQQTKVIELLEKTLKASSWIRRISFSQKLDPVLVTLLSQSTPIRIKEMLQRLREQMKPYLKNKNKNHSRSISLTLHADKTFIIQEWLKDPEVFVDGEPILIEGVSMFEFLTREVNFEILLDYILFSHEHGAKVLKGMSQLVPHFKKFKKFNPLKKTSECVLSALSSNNSEFTALQATKLLKLIFPPHTPQVFTYFHSSSCVTIFLKNFLYPQVRSFFFEFLLSNKSLPLDSQELIKSRILVDLFKRFSVILGSEGNLVLPVLDFLTLVLPEMLSEHFVGKADEFETSEALFLYRYRKALLTVEGHGLIASLFSIAFRDYWCSSNSEGLQELQFKCGELISLLIRSCQAFKPLKGIIFKSISEEYLVKIQANILHYSLNNSKPGFRLPKSLVTRPVGCHMIQLARIFSETLLVKPEQASKVSTNCWSSVFLWFFVFKSNGMILSHICSALGLMFEHSEERILKEVLFDKKFLFRVIDCLTEKPGDEDLDFTFFCKKVGRKICEYTENRKNKLTKDILGLGKWKVLFPPVVENVVKARPCTRSGKQGHTFILGLDPLQKALPKLVPKQEHEVEFLASQLDMIYKTQ